MQTTSIYLCITFLILFTSTTLVQGHDVFDINTYPIPKGISPNGDGKNENWDLTSIDVISLNLFNRYGQLVYEKKNYTNEWFGQNNNSQSLPDGTYFYVLHLECGTKTGWVYINK